MARIMPWKALAVVDYGGALSALALDPLGFFNFILNGPDPGYDK
jgi:hypothetical protein